MVNLFSLFFNSFCIWGNGISPLTPVSLLYLKLLPHFSLVPKQLFESSFGLQSQTQSLFVLLLQNSVRFLQPQKVIFDFACRPFQLVYMIIALLQLHLQQLDVLLGSNQVLRILVQPLLILCLKLVGHLVDHQLVVSGLTPFEKVVKDAHSAHYYVFLVLNPLETVLKHIIKSDWMHIEGSLQSASIFMTQAFSGKTCQVNSKSNRRFIWNFLVVLLRHRVLLFGLIFRTIIANFVDFILKTGLFIVTF